MLCTFCLNQKTKSEDTLVCEACQAKINADIERRESLLAREYRKRHFKALWQNRKTLYNKYSIPPLGMASKEMTETIRSAITAAREGIHLFTVQGGRRTGKSTIGISLLDALYLYIDSAELHFCYYPCGTTYNAMTRKEVIEAVGYSDLVLFDDIDMADKEFVCALLKDCINYKKTVIVTFTTTPNRDIAILLDEFGEQFFTKTVYKVG